MTDDEKHKELMVVLVGIREAIEDGFREINISIESIETFALETKDLVASIRGYMVGKIRRGE